MLLGGLPTDWRLESDPFDVTADRVVDVTLPAVASLAVRVLGEADVPIPDAEVVLPPYVRPMASAGVAFRLLSGPAGMVGTTGTDGAALFSVFDGSGPLDGRLGLVTPPGGSGHGAVELVTPLVAGDTVAVVRPPLEDSFSLSGTIRGPAGPIADAQVSLNGGGAGVTTSTGPDGVFRFAAPPEAYALSITAGRLSAQLGLPAFWRLDSEPFELASDRVVDVSVPTAATLTVRVLGAGNAPVIGAAVNVPLYRRSMSSDGLSFDARSGAHGAMTGYDGEAPFVLFDDSAPVDGQRGWVRPPPESGYVDGPLVTPALDGDTLMVVRFVPADATPPWVACDPPPTGWHTDEVSVACDAFDAGSGLADPADASFSLTTSVGDGNEDAAALTGTRQVCDLAGNCVTAGPVGPISVDRAPPTIVFSQQPSGANGWWIDTPATVHVTAADLNLSSLTCTIDGADSAMTPRAVSDGTLEGDLVVADSGRHTIRCAADDAVGHGASADEGVLIDLEPPRPPALIANRPPEWPRNGGWYADSVVASVFDDGDRDLADGSAGSGVDPASVPRALVYATSGMHVARATVRDLAGNESPAGMLRVAVDADPPVTTLTCPGVLAAGERAAARWSDRDGESGLAGRANGSADLDTSAVGVFTVEHMAVDHVGHIATSRCAYEVVAR